jgi:hypothetical protein
MGNIKSVSDMALEAYAQAKTNTKEHAEVNRCLLRDRLCVALGKVIYGDRELTSINAAAGFLDDYEPEAILTSPEGRPIAFVATQDDLQEPSDLRPLVVCRACKEKVPGPRIGNLADLGAFFLASDGGEGFRPWIGHKCPKTENLPTILAPDSIDIRLLDALEAYIDARIAIGNHG